MATHAGNPCSPRNPVDLAWHEGFSREQSLASGLSLGAFMELPALSLTLLPKKSAVPPGHL